MSPNEACKHRKMSAVQGLIILGVLGRCFARVARVEAKGLLRELLRKVENE